MSDAQETMKLAGERIMTLESQLEATTQSLSTMADLLKEKNAKIDALEAELKYLRA